MLVRGIGAPVTIGQKPFTATGLDQVPLRNMITGVRHGLRAAVGIGDDNQPAGGDDDVFQHHQRRD